MLLHRRKIAVIVQQGAATFDAKRSDDDVRCLPDRYAEVSQVAIIASGQRGQFVVEERHKGKLAQSPFDPRRMGLVPGALKNLEQNEIADQDRFASDSSFEFGGRGSP